MSNNEPMDDKSDDEWISTDPVDVRISGGGARARTVTVPGDAPLTEVKRKAILVARHAVGYNTTTIAWVDGWATRSDGGLHRDQRHPDYRTRNGVEAE